MSELISIERVRSGLVVVTFQRSEKRNALCIEMLKQLCEKLETLVMKDHVRVMILRGAGPVFSAGLDLTEAGNPELVEESAHCVARALHSIQHSPIISIAAVQGGAFAGGVGIVAACDLAIAATDAKFAFPEARRGLIPALVCEVLQSRVREGDLRELFLVGNTIDAQRAMQIGLLQRVTTNEKLIDEAIQIAEGILAGGPQTIVETKRLLNHAFGHDSESRFADRIAEHLNARRSQEAAEGLAAFHEKRPPSWSFVK